jgi:hypothetical protein
LLDYVAAQGTSTRHARDRGERRLYPDRSGFPKGIQAAKGAAKNFRALGKDRSETVLGLGASRSVPSS